MFFPGRSPKTAGDPGGDLRAVDAPGEAAHHHPQQAPAAHAAQQPRRGRRGERRRGPQRGPRGRRRGPRALQAPRRRPRARGGALRHVHPPGHPHHRVRAGLRVAHRLLPPALGPVAGPRAALGGALEHGDAAGRADRGPRGRLRSLPAVRALGLPHARHPRPHGRPVCVPPYSPAALGRVPEQVLHRGRLYLHSLLV